MRQNQKNNKNDKTDLSFISNSNIDYWDSFSIIF